MYIALILTNQSIVVNKLIEILALPWAKNVLLVSMNGRFDLMYGSLPYIALFHLN